MKTISVAIPCYRSAKTIAPVVEEIKSTVLSRDGYDCQIILVNDYPGDGTFDVIRSLCENDSRIIGVNLTKNYGQNCAKLAALNYFTGDVLIYMDDDGQHPADGIFKLADKIDEGYDLVYAHFGHKKHSAFKRLTSGLNSKIQEINGTKPKGIYLSSFCALSKSAVAALKKYKSPFPSIGGYLGHVVDKVANVEVEHRKRMEGKSNYTLRKLFKLWLNVFTNFSIVPLRVASVTGSIFAVGGFIFGIIIILRKLLNHSVAAGYTSTIALQLFIGGLIMIFLGLIGEYIGRIYMTVSNMPQYEIREVTSENQDGEKE